MKKIGWCCGLREALLLCDLVDACRGWMRVRVHRPSDVSGGHFA
jgi:hypothetical protein